MEAADYSGKLFVGGISWETDEDRLREYFGRFGEVTEAVIMRDRNTGRARGFGFVVFADSGVAERVTMDKHMIDGRMVLVLCCRLLLCCCIDVHFAGNSVVELFLNVRAELSVRDLGGSKEGRSQGRPEYCEQEQWQQHRVTWTRTY